MNILHPPQFIRFLFAGGINTLVDWGILNILLAATQQQTIQSYTVLKSISFTCAVTVSYILNKHFVFSNRVANSDAAQDTIRQNSPAQSSRTSKSLKEMVSFVCVSIVGWMVNTSVATYAAFSIALPFFWIRANLGAILGTCAGLLWNYIGYKRIVFKLV